MHSNIESTHVTSLSKNFSHKIEYFQDNLLILKLIRIQDNHSGVFTKETGETLLYRHMDLIAGKPKFANINN